MIELIGHDKCMSDQFNLLVSEIERFVADRDWHQFHSPKNLASSIAIESAELLECFQWSDPTPAEIRLDEQLSNQIRNEISDVFIYMLRLCSELGVDLVEATKSKIRLNGEKYPISKSKGNSNKYNRL